MESFTAVLTDENDQEREVSVYYSAIRAEKSVGGYVAIEELTAEETVYPFKEIELEDHHYNQLEEEAVKHFTGNERRTRSHEIFKNKALR